MLLLLPPSDHCRSVGYGWSIRERRVDEVVDSYCMVLQRVSYVPFVLYVLYVHSDHRKNHHERKMRDLHAALRRLMSCGSYQRSVPDAADAVCSVESLSFYAPSLINLPRTTKITTTTTTTTTTIRIFKIEVLLKQSDPPFLLLLFFVVVVVS